MASPLLFRAASANTLTDITKLSQRTSYDDILVLVLTVLGLIGYLLRGIVWDKQDPYHHVWFERPQESEAGARQREKKTRNIAEKLQEAVRTLFPISLGCSHVLTGVPSS